MPDHILATSLGDIETRMGLPSIESLLAERDTLVKEVALLRAKHGPFGTWGDLRKIELAKWAASIRAKAVLEERKLTEAAIEEAAHSHPMYVDFVTQGTSEKARWIEAENRIQGIEDTINRGNVVGRYLAQEIGLSR
jgi:chorismate mutase